jgi:hypothetical protein
MSDCHDLRLVLWVWPNGSSRVNMARCCRSDPRFYPRVVHPCRQETGRSYSNVGQKLCRVQCNARHRDSVGGRRAMSGRLDRIGRAHACRNARLSDRSNGTRTIANSQRVTALPKHFFLFRSHSDTAIAHASRLSPVGRGVIRSSGQTAGLVGI